MNIIHNKKIDLTQDEMNLYLKICKSYDRTNFQGSDLFKDLFETDENGIIVFIKPPSVKQTSMECYLFICSIYQHQHMRILYKKFENLENKITEKLQLLEEKVAEKKVEKKK